MTSSVTAVDKLLDLAGHTAIVTGASGGIGSAIAMRLAEAGAQVAFHYQSNVNAARNIVDAIENDGGRACAVAADLRHEADCNTLLDATLETLGRATILINCAGIQPVSELLRTSAGELEDVVHSNVSAPVMLTRLFANRYTGARSYSNCSVTHIASIEGMQPVAGHSHYASSKAALIMFTRAAAQELGPMGIRVNCVSPGLIDRPGLEHDWPDGVSRYRQAAPLGRIGKGRDIADAGLFLCSDAARWISGTNLIVDGGVSCAPTW